MKKAMLLVSILLTIFISIVVNINRKDSSQLIVEVFNQSNFNTVQTNINTYALLPHPLEDIDSMEQYLRAVDKNEDRGEIVKDEANTLKKIYVSKDVELTFKIKTIDIPPSTYLIVDVVLYGDCENIISVKEQLDNVFNALELKAKTNITVTGYYDGDMDYNKKRLTSFDIMKGLNATAEEDYVTDKIYSVVGYTKRIDEYIYSQEQKININLALRYNEYENKTYLYLATPIITIEY